MSNNGSSSKKRRQRKRKIEQNAVAKEDSDTGSPTIDLQSNTSSYSGASPLQPRRLNYQVDKTKTIVQIYEEFNLRPTG